MSVINKNTMLVLFNGNGIEDVVLGEIMKSCPSDLLE
jgi:hypothetical protein